MLYTLAPDQLAGFAVDSFVLVQCGSIECSQSKQHREKDIWQELSERVRLLRSDLILTARWILNTCIELVVRALLLEDHIEGDFKLLRIQYSQRNLNFTEKMQTGAPFLGT
jgi:hypothetical protein